MQESENNSDSFNLHIKDNKGRILSKKQQEYFKDSKVRDENGSLLEVYHGTPYDLHSGKFDTSSRKGKITVYETKDNWSRIGTNRWVCNDYLVSYNKNIVYEEPKKYTKGTYITTYNIHVRTNPGTKYTAKTYKQLTANARSQNKRLGNQYYNGYLKGVVCTVTKVNNEWGYTKSGWICLDYCMKK